MFVSVLPCHMYASMRERYTQLFDLILGLLINVASTAGPTNI